jgi:carbamoyltransferase
MTRILGISAFYHDSAACLVEEGKIVAAMQEERFSRRKHDSSFPAEAVSACLKMGGCSIGELDAVVFYEKPFLKFERLLETYSDHVPRGVRSYLKAIPVWIKDKLWMKEGIRNALNYKGEILFAEHHESHAASAFYPSPFESAAILTVDGVGEWTTTSLGRGEGSEIHLDSEIRFPHSLGLLYSTFTYYLGFEVNSGEYKLMGLAPYGQPVYAGLIKEHLVEIGADGAFRLNSRYFDYEAGLRMASSRLEELLGGPPRESSAPLTQRHKDLAASIQKVTEEILLKTTCHLRQQTGSRYLCLAGGVALNCVANGRILREAGYRDIWIQPAAGDAGGALGAALAVWHRLYGNGRTSPSGRIDAQQGSYLGTEYSDEALRAFLESQNCRYSRLEERELTAMTAQALADGRIVGWFQHRMEFGPRALGARSILADARLPEMRQRINSRVKFRESFRPFAPVILEDRVQEYFELDRPSPYMLLVAPTREERRAEIPAVTHVDGSARIQTVGAGCNPRFHRLLDNFFRLTGCPVLLNTSFNVRNEPIVESPKDAYDCFMRTHLDVLVLGSFYLDKKDQTSGLE